MSIAATPYLSSHSGTEGVLSPIDLITLRGAQVVNSSWKQGYLNFIYLAHHKTLLDSRPFLPV